jgi:uncharacterized membrane protein (Fun14 family)
MTPDMALGFLLGLGVGWAAFTLALLLVRADRPRP